MPAPAGAPHFPALLSATAALALWSTVALAADEARDLRLRLPAPPLPRYDPTIREKYLAAREAEEARIAAAQPVIVATATTGTSGKPSPDAIELPKMTVHPTFTLPKRLPRLSAPKPLRDLQGELFESGGARDARLIKKHLSGAAQVVNRLLGNSLVGLARAAEAQEQKAADMNALADGVELDTLLGRDPAVIKKVRDEYEKLYYSGPK